MQDFDVVVLGGGAAGLMCAITAGNRGRRVVVLEGSNRIGKKILMSGGGRCNFTNRHCEPSRFLSGNRHFCKSALSRYTQSDFIALVEKHGIPYHEKSMGQLFCDRSSKDIVAMLESECAMAGVAIITECGTSNVEFDEQFRVRTERGKFSGNSLVIATGGLSIPKMGATDFGYRLARQFGLNVLETRAGLVPFTFTGATHELTNRLSGVSTRATLDCGDAQFTEDILFTHRGLSGPAALQISSYWTPGDDIFVDLFPDLSTADFLLPKKMSRPTALLRTVLSETLPKALVIELQHLFWPEIAETPIGEIADSKLNEIGQSLKRWKLKPAATEGYRTAEVTLGGIDTDELSSKTMESKNQPGLFCIGEAVDVTGHLGGFNFQWAWASGHAAGEAA
jgi:predicted Rossmann fold flavoprotein